MTVNSHSTRSWILTCDGFDPETFSPCKEHRILSKLVYTLADAVKNETGNGWVTDPILGKHYCFRHQGGTP